MRILPFLLLAALLAGSLLFHAREEKHLARDWLSLKRAATATGLHLDGRTDGRSGWPTGASLSIDRPLLTSAGAETRLSAGAILLRRSLPDLGVLAVEPKGTLTLTLGAVGRRWRVWARHLALHQDRRSGWRLAVDRLRVAGGRGPDDVAAVEAARADLVPSSAGLQLTIGANGITLPLSSVPRPERQIASVAFNGRFISNGGGRELAVTRADLTWGDLAAHVAGRLLWRNGTPSGRLLLSLGSGWRAALERAGADGLISPSQARAAIGLLSLLSEGGEARDLPLAVQDGRVTLGGLTLIVLPGPTGGPH